MNDSATSRHSVAIIGAGLSGLTAAYCLHRRGMEVRVFESSPQPGGSVGTFRKDGYLCEAGPNTLMLADAEVEDFLKELGLLGSALTAGATAKKRFIVRGGKLLALPTGPGEFLTNPFLSLRDKWRVLGDLTAKPGANPDESIASFFERHFGPAVARELAGPFVSGVYAGNPESLVMRHAFPALWRADQTGGSVIRGLIAMKKKRRNPQGQAPPDLVGEWIGRIDRSSGHPAQRQSDLRRG
ncbi:protoporphyrinogen oxidase [Kamptonema cortianum]|nr:protoporphyrinogen oxidase [Kamptonema cortianum]